MGGTRRKISAGKKRSPARVAKKNKAGRARTRAREKPSPARPSFDVQPLDPKERCGARTSVEQLYRVTERVDGAENAHLVFFDKHGWYCLHGAACPAVQHARRFGDGARPAKSNGPTHNGRMRA